MPQPKTTRKPAAAEAAPDDQPEVLPVGAPAKLAYIQAHIPNVEKTGRNTHQKFDYFQEHGVLGLLRPFQRKLNVCVLVDFPGGIQHDGNMTTMSARVRFIDADEQPYVGDTLITNPLWMIEGDYPIQATDTQGWGAAKAQTYGKKYALQKFLGIPQEGLLEAEDESVPSTATGNRSTQPIRVSAPDELAGLRQALVDANAEPGRVKGKLIDLGVATVDDLPLGKLPEFKAWVLAETAKAA